MEIRRIIATLAMVVHLLAPLLASGQPTHTSTVGDPNRPLTPTELQIHLGSLHWKNVADHRQIKLNFANERTTQARASRDNWKNLYIERPVIIKTKQVEVTPTWVWPVVSVVAVAFFAGGVVVGLQR